MKEPKISVITVSLNAEKTIERTICSVLRQNYENLEYIIIDGDSSDRTVDIIRKYNDKLSYWISEPDEGLYYAMNKGLRVATGDYVIFLNSDDYFASDALNQTKRFLDNEDVDVFYGDIIACKESGESEAIHPWPLDSLRWCVPFCHQAVFMRRKEGLYFDTQFRIAADYNMLFEMYMKGAKFAYMPFVVSHFSMCGISSDYYKANLEIIDIACRIMNKYDQDKHIFRSQVIKQLVRIENRHRVEMGTNHVQVAEYLIKKSENTGKIIVFGSGHIAERYIDIALKYGLKVDYIVDNDKNKWGLSIFDIEIKSPEMLHKEKDCILYVATERYVDEILCQIDELGLDETVKVYNFIQLVNEFDSMTENEIIEYERKHIQSFDIFVSGI